MEVGEVTARELRSPGTNERVDEFIGFRKWICSLDSKED